LKPLKEQVVFEDEAFGEGFFTEDDEEDKKIPGVGQSFSNSGAKPRECMYLSSPRGC
jgi:hypothetical protein